MNSFSLTVKQLENILTTAKDNENQEDIVTFEVTNNRLIVSQNDWGHNEVKVIIDKPC